MCELVRIKFQCKAQISGLNKVEIYLCLPQKSRGRLSRTEMVVAWSSQIPASSVLHPEDSLVVQNGYWRFLAIRSTFQTRKRQVRVWRSIRMSLPRELII